MRINTLNMSRLLIVLLVLLSVQSIGQNKNSIPLTRKVSLEQDGKQIQFEVLIEDADFKLSPKIVYHWYKKDGIQQNVGGYAGFLLHGNYQVFAKSGQLIEQGSFVNGVKQGIWNYWNEIGNKTRIVHYENGWKHGNEILYHSDVEREVIPYKMGVLHGTKQVIKKDTSYVVRYKNGIEIRKEKKQASDNWVERLFRNKSKDSDEKPVKKTAPNKD